MIQLLQLLFPGLFQTNEVPRPSNGGGYYEGDDSPWIMTDSGPRLGR